MHKLKIFFITCLIIFLFIININPQAELLSAKNLLERLSGSFKANVKDLKAEVKLIQGNTTSTGTLLFKNPQKVRIDFSDPANQVICSNGYELWVYIPYLNIVLHQDILERERMKKDEDDEKNEKEKNNDNKNNDQVEEPEIVTNPILLNPVGLDKFLTEYSIEYHETKEKVSYKDGSKVYKMKLIRWRSTKHGFNVIYLTIQENGIIRQVRGVTASYKQIILELDRIELNTNISALKFDYEPPAHTSTVDDFINK
jgi:outer membrane lipoprotein-sorting protein